MRLILVLLLLLTTPMGWAQGGHDHLPIQKYYDDEYYQAAWRSEQTVATIHRHVGGLVVISAGLYLLHRQKRRSG